MADYLTTNWTEKIKSNPVANLVLNSNRTNLHHLSWKTITNRNQYMQNGETKDIFAFGREAQTINQNQIDWFKNNNVSKQQVIQKIEQGQMPFGFFGAVNDDGEAPEVDPIDFYDINQIDENVEVPDYWANTYVQDYINIDHPKLRPCYIQALSNSPLSIKPPSVFFSDV